MLLYLFLLMAHFFGDLYLQKGSLIVYLLNGRSLSRLKREKLRYVILHVILYTISVSIILICFSRLKVISLVIVFTTHLIIDYIKCYLTRFEERSTGEFIIDIIDQTLHIAVLFIVINI